MAATVQINRYTGVGEDETADIEDILFGDLDSAILVPVDYPITPGNNSYEVYVKFEVTDMTGLSAIDTLKVWKSGGPALGVNTDLKASARESSYVNPTYATPVKTASSIATQDMPTSEPAGANWGIAGSLSGQLSAVGFSDHLVMQVQTTSSETDGKEAVLTVSWDEIP